MYVFGPRQRNTIATVQGGGTRDLCNATKLEGAVGFVVKYHSGTGTTPTVTAWVIRTTWDGTSFSSGNDSCFTVRGTTTINLCQAEATAPWLFVYHGYTATDGVLLPMPCDRVKLQVTTGGTTPTNDTSNAIVDIWPIYLRSGVSGPNLNRIGMPT